MKSISKDSDVTADVISPLGNITADDARKNATYEELMYRNLEKLSKAMLCN
jgi:zinc transport system substrate-binding protein